MTISFPDDFLWGSSTAAYQVEGAATEGGRGESIWDRFAHAPGRISDGQTGDVACDHYHRFADDVAIMAQLGLGAYRFSLAWPRLQPAGTGRLHAAGVDFYDRLLDALLAAGIRPWATLYHWDLPQPLEDVGGWPLRDTAYRYVDYATAVHDRFADRITDWITLNEPWCSAFLGYFNGVHAPGRTEPAAALRAMHHLLLAHGSAVTAMRAARSDQRYGVSLNLYPVDPARDTEADLDAARRVDGVCNRLFTHPVLGGGYPDDVVQDLARIWPDDAIRDGDEATIAADLDMLGVNYYTRNVVRAGAPPGSTVARDNGWIGCDDVGKVDRGLSTTTMGWEIDPQGLGDVLTRLRDAYPELPPIYVTENGASFDDVVGPDDSVHDAKRVAFLADHVRAAAVAIADGVDLRGYFVWSLIDNFEWSFGYSRRFGVVHIDYTTQQRTIKDSGRFLGAVAANNGLPD